MKNLDKRSYLEKSTAFILDELITTGFRIWHFSADLDDYLETYSANVDEQKVTILRTKVADQIEKREGLVEGLNTRFTKSEFGTDIIEIIRIELMEFTTETQKPVIDKINTYFDRKIANRFLELLRVDYACWESQEHIMKDGASDNIVAKYAKQAQLKNSERSQLMIELDEMLNESYRTVATKTYTYFENEEKENGDDK